MRRSTATVTLTSKAPRRFVTAQYTSSEILVYDELWNMGILPLPAFRFRAALNANVEEIVTLQGAWRLLFGDEECIYKYW